MPRTLRVVLVMSLLLNVGGMAALVLYVRHKGAHATLVKIGLAQDPRPNFAQLAHQRFGGLPGAAVVFWGDSQVQDAPFGEFVKSARRGIGTQTINDLATWTDLVTGPETKRLVILVGTNDALQHRSEAQELRDYLALLDDIRRRSPTVSIVLLTVPVPRGLAAQGRDVNQALRAAAASRHAQVVDFAAAVTGGDGTTRPELTLDGTHLNGRGYAAAEAALNAAAGVR